MAKLRIINLIDGIEEHDVSELDIGNFLDNIPDNNIIIEITQNEDTEDDINIFTERKN